MLLFDNDLNFYCYFITCLFLVLGYGFAGVGFRSIFHWPLHIAMKWDSWPINRKGTEARQEHLTKGKYFECKCRRCDDPTEFGTHLSSVRCQSCTMGYMIRMDCRTTWKCLNCSIELRNEQIQLILRDIRVQVQQIGPNIEHIEMFIAKYTQILHPNHYLLIEMKQKLAAVIRHMGATTYDSVGKSFVMDGNDGGRNSSNQRSHSPFENLLKRKIDLCKEFIPLLQILQPGISRLKAIALYEQFTPLVQLAKLHHQRKLITDAEYLVNIIIYESFMRVNMCIVRMDRLFVALMCYIMMHMLRAMPHWIGQNQAN